MKNILQKTIVVLSVLICFSSFVRAADDRNIIFDPNVNYDVFFNGQGFGSFVIKRVKIVDTVSINNESAIVVKTDKSFSNGSNRGYIFMKGVYSIVPSDYFVVESVSQNDRR